LKISRIITSPSTKELMNVLKYWKSKNKKSQFRWRKAEVASI